MAAKFIRVQDIRTGDILPKAVPESFLTAYPHLKEVPSSAARRAQVDGAAEQIPDAVLAEEPQAPTPRGKSKPITEPARPDTQKEA